MSTYDTLRHFADSWGLLFLTLAVGLLVGPEARAQFLPQTSRDLGRDAEAVRQFDARSA